MDTRDYTFRWKGDLSLDAVLKKPIKAVSLRMCGKVPGPVSLWHQDGSWLEIWSEMADLAERREVGILALEVIKAEPKYDHIVFCAGGPKNVLDASRLTVEGETTYPKTQKIDAEVGIILDIAMSRSLTIVGGAFPLSLAILGWFDIPGIFDPAYQIHEYRKSPFGRTHST